MEADRAWQPAEAAPPEPAAPTPSGPVVTDPLPASVGLDDAAGPAPAEPTDVPAPDERE